MKKCHTDDFYCWSVFNEERNIDFHSYVWRNQGALVVFDPLPLSDHDWQHLQQLGNVAFILISNSDHLRNAKALASKTGASIFVPEQERSVFGDVTTQGLSQGSFVMNGLEVVEWAGSKTPGELAFVVDHKTMVTGDLIRSHQGGQLCLLPDAKLSDKAKAIRDIQRFVESHRIEAVLTGDGWPCFTQGQQALQAMLERL